MDVDRIKNTCSETLILSLLRDRAMHGYEMCLEIERRAGGYFSLKHSTLYPLLHRLEKQGFIVGEWKALDAGKPKKVYKLTRKGRAFYSENAQQWRELFVSLTRLVPEVAP